MHTLINKRSYRLILELLSIYKMSSKQNGVSYSLSAVMSVNQVRVDG